MSVYTQNRGSFIHIYKKYGAAAVQEHSFVDLLIGMADKSDEWFSIPKDLAEKLIHVERLKEAIMCREVDMDNRKADDTDYVGVTAEDLDERGEFPQEWKTFVIAI